MKVKVLDQTDDSIEFRIPPSVKPGRLQLLVKTAGHQPMLIEQPVFITIEEPDQKLEATTAPPADAAR
jgi:siroheme synthase (precorrin-2 oxidase/ferrochelatase)